MSTRASESCVAAGLAGECDRIGVGDAAVDVVIGAGIDGHVGDGQRVVGLAEIGDAIKWFGARARRFGLTDAQLSKSLETEN